MRTGITFNMYGDGYNLYGGDSYKKIKEHGYSCVDFALGDTETPVYNSSDEAAKKILLNQKQRAEAAGIEIWQVHGPWRWPPRDRSAEDRTERMEKMKRSLWFCNVLGCKNWVIHPIMPYGIEDIGTGNEQSTWDMNLEFMSELLKTAKEYGITICYENMPMPRFSLAAPADVLRFVKTIDDDNFKICLDTGHVSVFDALDLAESIRMLGDEIRVLHVHDNKKGLDLHMMPYFGIIDWAGFSGALKDIGFTGVLSLETVPPSLPDMEIFEGMCVALGKIARRIADSAL